MSTGFSRFGRVFVILALVFASCRGGTVVRGALTLQDLTEDFATAEPLDMAYLSVPEYAAAPRHTFEGRLELLGEAEGGIAVSTVRESWRKALNIYTNSTLSLFRAKVT